MQGCNNIRSDQNVIATLRESLSRKIHHTDGCWVWIGAKTHNGYGRLNWRGKTQRAHRLMYELIHGKVPEGLWVLHKCDNPECTNPNHLFIGTPRDNSQDRDSKGRNFDRTGIKLSAETIAKISASKKGHGLGRKLGPKTEVQKLKQSLAMRGRKLSEEHRAKIAAGTKIGMLKSWARRKGAAI